MAKKLTPNRVSSVKRNNKGTGKKKTFILVIVVILVLLGIILAVFREQLQDTMFSEDENEYMENIAVEEVQDQEFNDPLYESDGYDDYSDFNVGDGPGYYVRIAQCIYKSCVQNALQQGRLLRLPTLKKRSKKSTVYFELITAESFSKRQALDAIEILKELKGGTLFLVPHKKEFKISFGSFPDLSRAEQNKSKLARLYPDISLRFVIKPLKKRYTLSTIFVGPLISKPEARNALVRLNKNLPDVEMIITTKPR